MIDTAHIDYETRSRAALKVTGAPRYAIDRSTDILMAGVSEDDSDRVLLWINPKFFIPDMPGDENEEAEDILRRAKYRKAHNVPFELAITWGAHQRRAASPFKSEPDINSWRDTAALARKAGLPWSLEKLGDALNLPIQKDKEGKALIQFFCVPRKDGKFNEPRDHVEKWLKFCNYCRTDVIAEKLADKKLKPFELQGAPLETFLFDLRMNHRGIPINVPAATNAQKIINEVQADIGKRFRKVTGLNPTQREKVRLLVGLPDMQAETVEAAIDDLTSQGNEALLCQEPVNEILQRRDLLEMYQKLSYAAVKKVQTMLDMVCPDGRIRGTMIYYGAGTGRWCLTGDHEVLTRDGWKRLDQWQSGEIACWRPETEAISFQKSKQVSFPFSGILYHQKSNRIDQLATGDHRMPGWKLKTDEFEIRPAKDLKRGFQLPFTGWRDRPSKIAPDELRLLIAAQADGHFTPEGELKFHFKKVRKIERLHALLTRLQLPRKTTRNGDGSTSIEIAARHVPLFLVLFRDKTFGAWILDMDAAVFFDELEHWDACRCGPNSLQYSTTNKINAEWIQALAHTSGMAASVTIKKGREGRNWAPSHVVSIWLTPKNRHQVRSLPKPVKFKSRVYCASTPTGFFLVRRNGIVWVTGNTARGLQPHNMKRTPAWLKGMTEEIYAQICKSSDTASLEAIWGEPIELIAGCIRHFVDDCGPILDGDYNAIEGRIGCWIAGQADILEDWRLGKDLYKRAAAFIYNVPESSIGKGAKRDFGKVVELACQFGLGEDGFINTCAKFGIECPPELARRAIREYYRPTHKKIVARWYYLDDCMREAIAHPGTTCGPFSVRVISGIRYLLLKLPSGRSLAYPHPEIKRREPTAKERKEMEGGKNYPDKRFLEVTYWGEIAANKWGRVKLHGSKVFENEVQATAADFMAHGAIIAEKRGMEPFMLVHDQALARLRPGLGAEDFERALGDLPTWARGMPLKVEAKITRFYTK